jgi:predicted ester cyclase
MSTEANKAITRQVYQDIFGQGQMSLIDELCAADYIEHVPPVTPGQPTRGPEALKALVSRIRTAFPDLRITIDVLLAEGDTVAVRSTWRGTHTGPFGPLPPTGKPAVWAVMDIGRIVEGKLVEHWGQPDLLGLLQQLGAAPVSMGA